MPNTIAAPKHLPTLVALSGGAALILGAMSAAPAWAHDTLIGSTPEADEVLEESPEEIVLEFSGSGLTTGESIPNTIWVTDSEDEHWEGETEVDGPTMRTELEEPLPNGEYEVLYHAVYSDGHSEELSFSFEVDAAVEDEEESAEASTEPAEDDAEAEEAEPAETDPAETQEAAADEPDTAEDTPTEELDGDETAAQEEQFPMWTAIAVGAGVVVLLVLGVILVRRKLTQND